MAEIGFYYNLLYFYRIYTIFLSELSMQQYGILIKSSKIAKILKIMKKIDFVVFCSPFIANKQ